MNTVFMKQLELFVFSLQNKNSTNETSNKSNCLYSEPCIYKAVQLFVLIFTEENLKTILSLLPSVYYHNAALITQLLLVFHYLFINGTFYYRITECSTLH